MDDTRPSLLNRLRGGDDSVAWEDFFHQYSGVILRYARKLRLNDQQGLDILQETMIELMRVLPRFEYDRRRGKFRNFLITIVHRKILRSICRRERRGETSMEARSEDGVPYAELLAAPASGTEEIERRDELRWRSSVLETCLERLRLEPSIQPVTLDIFEAFAIQGRPARDVAERFDTNENNVFQVKSRVMARLRRDVQAYLGGEL